MTELDRLNAFLTEFGAKQIPLLGTLNPRLTRFDEHCCEVLIPLFDGTRNHLNSMYFAVLAAGADCAGGFPAMQAIMTRYQGISLVFKDFKAEFLKRAEGDVAFRCNQVKEVNQLVEKAQKSGERESMLIKVEARVPSIEEEPVALFKLTLSLKRKL